MLGSTAISTKGRDGKTCPRFIKANAVYRRFTVDIGSTAEDFNLFKEQELVVLTALKHSVPPAKLNFSPLDSINHESAKSKNVVIDSVLKTCRMLRLVAQKS